jgi:hypothetical protein
MFKIVVGRKFAIFIFAMYLFFCFSFVSASWNNWAGYSINGDSTIDGGNGVFTNSSFLNRNTSNAYLTSEVSPYTYQSISFTPDSTGREYLVFPNGNYLQVYDSFMFLKSEINTNGNVKGQISAINNKIYGFWAVNSSLYSFRGYSFNATTSLFSKDLEINYTDLMNTTGVRCYSFANPLCLSWFFNGSSSSPLIYFRENYLNGTDNKKFAFVSDSYPLNVPTVDDWNKDGNSEVLGYSSNSIFINDLNSLNLIINWSEGATVGNSTIKRVITSALFGKIDSTPYDRLIVVLGSPYHVAVTHEAKYKIYKHDYSLLYQNVIATYSYGGLTADYINTYNVVLGDYNNDNYQDIVLSYQFGSNNVGDAVKVYRGYDGTVLYTNNNIFGKIVGGHFTPYTNSLNSLDIFLANGTNLYLINGLNFSNVFVYSINNIESVESSDLNFDGNNELIFSKTAYTGFFDFNNINSLPVINLVSYSPSLNIIVGQEIDAYVNATDIDSDVITYAVKCDNSENISSFGYNPIQACVYSNVGIKNLTVYVADSYHLNYNSFSQPVSVLISSTSCNNNGICESGETSSSCSNDCSGGSSNSIIGGGNDGSMALPSQLVNIDDENEGFLPSIYYSLIRFFSIILPFLIPIVSVFFLVLIAISLFMIVGKIFGK